MFVVTEEDVSGDHRRNVAPPGFSEKVHVDINHMGKLTRGASFPHVLLQYGLVLFF